MRSVEAYFAEYAEHHRTVGNKATHFIGIPLIVLCLLGLASRVPLFSAGGTAFDLAMALGVLLVIAYLAMHVGLAIGVAVLLVPLYLAGTWLTWPWLLGLLAVGVGLQYLGHYAFEGRSPAFHDNLVHTLVGPLWIAALFFSALRLYRLPR